MNIRIQDILYKGTSKEIIKAKASIIGDVPCFLDKDGVIKYISDSLSVVTSSYIFKGIDNKIESNTDILVFLDDSIFQFFPCGLSYDQEYCMSYFELIEESSSDYQVGIYSKGEKSLEHSIDLDRQSYIIGIIVDGLPVLLPPIGQYLRDYFVKNEIRYDIDFSMKHLKVGDLYIPIWENDVEVGKKYKYSCKLFQDEGFYPDLAGCLELDGILFSKEFQPV